MVTSHQKLDSGSRSGTNLTNLLCWPPQVMAASVHVGATWALASPMTTLCPLLNDFRIRKSGSRNPWALLRFGVWIEEKIQSILTAINLFDRLNFHVARQLPPEQLWFVMEKRLLIEFWRWWWRAKHLLENVPQKYAVCRRNWGSRPRRSMRSPSSCALTFRCEKGSWSAWLSSTSWVRGKRYLGLFRTLRCLHRTKLDFRTLFAASKAVDALMDSKWGSKAKSDPLFSSRQICVDYCDRYDLVQSSKSRPFVCAQGQRSAWAENYCAYGLGRVEVLLNEANVS